MPKRSKKKLKLFDDLYDVGNKSGRKRIDGRLHVRVVDAVQLTAGDHRLFRKGTSDPFCVVVFRDDTGYYSRRRTRTIEKSRDPVWRQQFTFGVRDGTNRVSLDFDVWDEDCDEKTDDFLGTATKMMDLTKLDQANMWVKYQLPLKEDKTKGNIKGSVTASSLGYITVLVYYEPWSQATWWMAFRLVMSSPKAISTFTSTWCACIAALCVVAGEGRWLCRGDDLRTCEEVELLGMRKATDRAAIYTIILAFVQFFGAMGAWGSDWNSSPPHVHELLEDPEDEDAEEMIAKQRRKQMKHDMEEPCADVHLVFAKAGSSLIDYKIFIGLNNIKRWSAKNLKLTLRYIAFMLHLLAIVLLALAGLWAKLQRGEGIRYGEGFGFGMVAMINLIITFGMFRRTRFVLTEDSVWQMSSGWKRIPGDHDDDDASVNMGRWEMLQRQVGRFGRAAHERVVEPIKDKTKQAKNMALFSSPSEEEDGEEGDAALEGSSSYYMSGMSGALDAYDLEGAQPGSAARRTRTPDQKKQGYFCGACR